MRILIMNWRYMGHPKSGGAEYWTQRVAEELLALGHSVTVFTSKVNGLPRVEDINGITVLRRGGTLNVYYSAKRFLRKRGSQFDFILDEVNTRPFFVHKYTNVPSRAMFHQIAREVWDFEMPWPLSLVGRYLLEPYWLRQFRQKSVLVLSQSTANSLKAFGVKVHRVVLPGIDDFENPNVAKANLPTICFLGRLVSSKRPQDVVSAFELAKKDIKDLQLIMIGDGPLREELELEKIPSMFIAGRVPDRRRNELIASSHVLVATSAREGWGMNVSEAAELGTISIGYNVDGLRDSITEAGGILVPESHLELARELIEYFKSQERKIPRKLGRTWRDVARELEIVMEVDVSLERGVNRDR